MLRDMNNMKIVFVQNRKNYTRFNCIANIENVIQLHNKLVIKKQAAQKERPACHCKYERLIAFVLNQVRVRY